MTHLISLHLPTIILDRWFVEYRWLTLATGKQNGEAGALNEDLLRREGGEGAERRVERGSMLGREASRNPGSDVFFPSPPVVPVWREDEEQDVGERAW